MPTLQTTLNALNAKTAHGAIREFARTSRDKFAPDTDVAHALAEAAEMPALYEYLKAHLANTPGGIAEALRATIHYALGTNPPTLITFAWAPSYDYELNIWQAPDTEATKGGITILFKSRYPDHAHPLKK
jgi:hypothetical protein